MAKFNAVTKDGNTFSVLNGKPTSVKKITATRFSKVLGCNHWGDEFQAWCEIMKVAEPPFEGNKYTNAGQVIEPKLIEFCKDIVSPYIVAPQDYYEKVPANFDFFEDKLFGGMWDALAFWVPNAKDGDGNVPCAIIECKTTSRPQDWERGVPEHYKAQGLLYAYLLGVNDVYFPVAFLEPKDYDQPEGFVCDETNTRVYHITRADKIVCFDGVLLTIDEAIEFAKNWWDEFVEGNVSPEFDARKDKDYLDIIRTVDISETEIDVNNLDSLLDALYEADKVIAALTVSSGIAEWEDKRKAINKAVQDLVKPQLENGDILDTNHYKFTKSLTRKVDYDKLIADGLYDTYVKESSSIRCTLKKEK